jgi:hypothetical protein
MLQNDLADEYVVDDEGRIRPVHQMGWAKERWNDASSFDEAMMGVATLSMADAFPADNGGLSDEDFRDLEAKRYLDIADGFFLATGIDVRFGVYRFTWQGAMYLTMRPDFFFKSLVNNLNEPPVNALESTVRDRLLDYYRELDALTYALVKGELKATEVYPMEWWIDFWKVRGIAVSAQVLDPSTRPAEKPLKTTERNTLLTIIAALCDYSALKPNERGTAVEIAKLTEEIGAAVSDDTVRRVLDKIPEALEARMK